MSSIKEIADFNQKPKIISVQNKNRHKINIQLNEPEFCITHTKVSKVTITRGGHTIPEKLSSISMTQLT